MAKPMVVVTRAVPREALELLASHATVDANGADVGYTPEELISHARNADAIDAIGKEAGILGAQNVIASSIDVRDTEQVRTWIEHIVKTWGGVDVLVNNAGNGAKGIMEESGCVPSHVAGAK